MPVNAKKPIRLKNRTKYFNPKKDKSFVRFASPNSNQSKDMKIEGYETRLYWQWKYCQAVGGQTFYYTLTYNDKSLPQKYGINCFDYEDLRDFLTGGFRKQLLRNYGTTFKYFIGAELGDGKGKRGLHNNPHYHILFFLEPDKNPEHDFPYIKISEIDFRHLVRLYWQGIDQYDKNIEKDRFVDYKKFKYGIAKEGEKLGLVYSYSACTYVAKYCCKDIKLKMHEANIRSLMHLKLNKELKNDPKFFESFFHEVVYPLYNIPANAKGEWRMNDAQLLVKLLPDLAEFFEKIPDSKAEDFFVDETRINDIKRICYRYGLWDKFNEFKNEFMESIINDAITEWRNRYCNKCRISQGVGDYALKFVEDKLNPTFEVATKDGKKERPMNLYYYRKLFTTVVYPFEKTMNGKTIRYPNIRILNPDGIKYKVNRLKKQIAKKSQEAKNNMNIILGNKELYYKMCLSNVNTDVHYTYEDMINRFEDLINSYHINIYERYAEYKLVYEDRYFEIPNDGCSSDCSFPIRDTFKDYETFLYPSILSISRSDLRLDAFIQSCNEGYLSYAEHPDFLPFIGIFNLFDLCTDYFFIQKDNKLEKEANERQKIRKFHVKRKIKDYFSKNFVI